MDKTVADFMRYANDPRLPLDEMREVLASIRGRIHPSLERRVMRLIDNYEKSFSSIFVQFPGQKITEEILNHLAGVPAKDKVSQQNIT